MIGFDESSGKVVDSFGGIALLTAEGEPAAFWSFAKLMDHWKRKHENVVFVPGLTRIESTEAGSLRQYRYGRRVLAGCGTDFNLLLRAFHCGNVFLDPALKLVELAGVTTRPKCRNQFRVKFPRLVTLYRSTEEADVCSIAEQGVALPTT